MKANKIQQYICDVIHSQVDFWKHSNDITSPTHLVDIEEECNAQFINLMEDEDIKDNQWSSNLFSEMLMLHFY